MDLNKLLSELENHKTDKSRDDLLAAYIQLRLEGSLKSYYNEIDKSIQYLSARNEVKVLNKINKI